MLDVPIIDAGITTLWPWLRISPPLLAIGLSIYLKDVNLSLLLGTCWGCLLITDLSPLAAFNLLTDGFIGQIADADHASVILFTLLLGSMIGVMNDSGGTDAVVNRLARLSDTREKAQGVAWFAGLIIFFDDYANTMLIGGSMRSVCDRMSISRAKLAYVIDSTAAPVAGLAISTWTAFEIDQVQTGLTAAGVVGDADSIFFATIPFRLYPIITIFFVATIAFSGRDFGAMLRSEQQAARSQKIAESSAPEESKGNIWLAILPVVTLVASVIVGYVNNVDAYRLLLLGSMVATGVAAILTVLTRTMSISECSESITKGIMSMIPAMIVLVLAWAVSEVCSREKLDTAGFIVSLVKDSLRPELVPAVAFIAACAVSISIGSSFTTMALLVPMFIPLTASILQSHGVIEGIADNNIFLASVGAILAGAIFGDHCSPISDTTVLSSAAAGCNHLEHVNTQMPYALAVGACSLVFGYLPMGFGLPWWVALPLSTGLCCGMIMVFGRKPNEVEKNKNLSDDPQKSLPT